MRKLEEAFYILSDYHAKHDLRQIPISVDRLRDIIIHRGYVQTISLLKVDYPRHSILGGVKFFEKVYGGGWHVEIYYNRDLPKEWERVVACKEMCHAILDEDGERVTNAHDLIPHIQALHSNILPTPAAQSEFLAEVLAVELLMPIELRWHHLEAYAAGTITPHQLALRYWVPESFVEMAMTEALVKWVDQHREKRVAIT